MHKIVVLLPHFDFWYALGAVDFCFDYDLFFFFECVFERERERENGKKICSDLKIECIQFRVLFFAASNTRSKHLKRSMGNVYTKMEMQGIQTANISKETDSICK